MRMWAIRNKQTKKAEEPNGEFLSDDRWIVTVQPSNIHPTKKHAKDWLNNFVLAKNHEVAELVWKDEK